MKIKKEKQKRTYMVNNLVCRTAVVLQEVVVLGTAGDGDLLCHGLLERELHVSERYYYPPLNDMHGGRRGSDQLEYS
jgi:hypothetical protein